MQVKGTSTADVIVAGNGDHLIDGRGGNDRICAGGGNDRVFGGGGSDWIDSGSGDDVVEGENGSDRVIGRTGSDTILGNRGNDQISAGAGDEDFADAGLGDDSASGGPGLHDRVIGGVGNDRLEGGPGGEDVLRGDRGADVFDGGEGEHDTASFAVSGFDGPIEGGQGVIVDLTTGRASQDGADRLIGIEDVIGTAFRDHLQGNSSVNLLYGGGGDDQIYGSGQGDRALAGEGSDICVGVEQAYSCGVEERQREPIVEVALSGGGAQGSLTVVGREPQFIPGSLAPSGSVAVSVEVGFEGGEWTVAGGPKLRPGEGCAVVGAEVRCPVSTKPDAVLVSGNSGDDLLVMKENVPASVSGILHGDAGADFLLGGPGDDSLNAGGKDADSDGDILSGRGGDDALANGKVLLGGRGSDLIIASPCAGQSVKGGPGDDSVSFARTYLGLGVQVQVGGSAVFPSLKLAGKSVAAGCSIIDSTPTAIAGSIENVEGSPKEDVLIGNQGANILLGRGGADRVLGVGGDDFLVGGSGRDEVNGGRGDDRLYVRDGKRDRRLDCGMPTSRMNVAKVDPVDPVAANCRILP